MEIKTLVAVRIDYNSVRMFEWVIQARLYLIPKRVVATNTISDREYAILAF